MPNVMLIDPRLFFQMLNQVADGQNKTTARLAEELGKAFDPDDPNKIIISQTPIQVIEDGGSAPDAGTGVLTSPATPATPGRTPSGDVGGSRIARASLLAKRSSTGELA